MCPWKHFVFRETAAPASSGGADWQSATALSTAVCCQGVPSSLNTPCDGINPLAVLPCPACRMFFLGGDYQIQERGPLRPDTRLHRYEAGVSQKTRPQRTSKLDMSGAGIADESTSNDDASKAHLVLIGLVSCQRYSIIRL